MGNSLVRSEEEETGGRGVETREEEDSSVVILASDLGIDARPFLSPSSAAAAAASSEEEDDDDEQQRENWHDCPSSLPYYNNDEVQDFSDLDDLQIFRLQGFDKAGNRMIRVVGKYFPAPVVSGERLKKYIYQKIFTELPEGPYSIVYFHSTVQKEDNNPGLSILRWIYEELPLGYKERLKFLYFVHPGLRSRVVFATLGRFFLSEGLYWKIKYISRLQYLWEDMKKGEIEIPEFVQNHDDVLEERPLTDYGIEPDPLHLTEVPSLGYSLGRHEERWASREYMS